MEFMEEMTMTMWMVFWIGEIVAPPGGDSVVGGSSVGAQRELLAAPPLRARCCRSSMLL